MSERKERIKEIVVDRMNLKIKAADIADDQAIFGNSPGSLGLDSIDALDLVVALYEEFNVEIQDSDMHIFASVATIDAFVEGKMVAQVA